MPAPLTVADLQQAQAQDNSWLQGFLQQMAGWQQGRDPYYASLQQMYEQSQMPGLQQQVKQAGRQQAFSAARRGVRGGSSDMAGQEGVQGMLAAGLANIRSGGQAMARQQRAEDQQAMQGWEQQATTIGPGQQIASQAALDASRARAGLTGQMGDVASQQYLSQQQYQGMLSQLLGGQLSNLGWGVQAAAANGTSTLANWGRG
jgi:hypothetical protein